MRPFDVGFMNANYERHGMPIITQPVIDTLEFARNLYPEYKRHGLGPLTKTFPSFARTPSYGEL